MKSYAMALLRRFLHIPAVALALAIQFNNIMNRVGGFIMRVRSTREQGVEVRSEQHRC
jgi:hypothetical protein